MSRSAASLIVLARDVLAPALIDGSEARADLLALLAVLFTLPDSDVDALARAVVAECARCPRRDFERERRALAQLENGLNL